MDMTYAIKGGALEPLDATARQTDPDWPGVVVYLSEVERVALSSDASRFLLQRIAETDDGPRWMSPRGPKTATLSAFVAHHGPKVPGLAESLDGVPERPEDAAPDFYARWSAMKDAFNATDWRRDDYARVICHDGNMRLVVDPEGVTYRVQWQPRDAYFSEGPFNSWHTQFIGPDTDKLRSLIHQRVYDTDDWDAPACQGIIRALDEAPRLARDGAWPILPERPKGVRQ